ncbi:hypothetical protein D3C86_2027020 [compost metagenome]
MKASRPHQAVRCAGNVVVRIGSSNTRSALVSAPQIQSFLPSGPAKMLVADVSEPVPAVVGTMIFFKGVFGSGLAASA